MRPLLALGLSAMWLGGAVLLAASVAPAAFASLPSPALAGAVVGRVLPVIFISGFALGLVVALRGLGDATSGHHGARVAAAVWAIACGAGQFVVGPAIARLRIDAMGPIDVLVLTDPRRMMFGRLHMASVGLLGLGMLAALVVAGLAIASAHQTVTT